MLFAFLDRINKCFFMKIIFMIKQIKTTEAIFPMPVLLISTFNEDGTRVADAFKEGLKLK